MKEKSKSKRVLRSKAKKDGLSHRFPLLAEHYDDETREKALAFNEAYKAFLNEGKTEREIVGLTVREAEALGFVNLREQKKLRPGQKVYHSIKGKGLVLALIGSAPVEEGFRILGAHIDSPRLDLKPLPLYEEKELVYFKTHYYGGIKKYQWASIPLALHGSALRGDGSRVDIRLGEKDEDPKFVISDLLPHLGAEQMSKKATEIIPGEALNILVGATPEEGEGKSRFKAATLRALNALYGLEERDLATAELCAVPASKASDIGFDRLLQASYGQDDRVCAYPAIQTLFDVKKTKHTAVALLSDKEEIGSLGNTGADSRLYENVLLELFVKLRGAHDELLFRRTLEASAMLSADVTNAYDPNFASVSDEKNSCYLGHGIALIKYTGSRGKSMASDANAEFISRVTRLLDAHGICWQIGEMGKVDAGGGGTIAHIFAGMGMEVVDCGVPVLSMHSPFEISHKFDVYETYRAYRCFVEED